MELIAAAKRPIVYAGGGVINSGPRASQLLRELVRTTGVPITTTLMGLGAFPASDPHFLGMLGMHGTYEANMAMHDCDVMIAVGARFDDRVTGRLDAFSPELEEDPHRYRSVLDQQERARRRADHRRCRPCARGLHRACGRRAARGPTSRRSRPGGRRSTQWRGAQLPALQELDASIIKPQYAIQRLYALTKDRDVYITTEVGQHQMWAAQSLQVREAEPLDDLGRARHHGLRACPPRSACRSRIPKRSSSTSPARPRS